jgi:hypothetical protein
LSLQEHLEGTFVGRARALDHILSVDLAEDDNVLRDLLRQRNGSILAHGLEPVGEASAKRFLSYVDEMVDRPQIRAQATHPRLEGLQERGGPESLGVDRLAET